MNEWMAAQNGWHDILLDSGGTVDKTMVSIENIFCSLLTSVQVMRQTGITDQGFHLVDNTHRQISWIIKWQE